VLKNVDFIILEAVALWVNKDCCVDRRTLKRWRKINMDQSIQQDIEAIISHQYDHGVDLWSTPDHKLLKGAPFTTLECPHYLLALGMTREETLLKETAALIFQGWREDGRFKISPSGGIYPLSYSTGFANAVCSWLRKGPTAATDLSLFSCYSGSRWRLEV